MSNVVTYPVLAVHPGHLVRYYRTEGLPGNASAARLQNLSNIRGNSQGKVSVNARRKVAKAIDYLLFCANDKCLPNTASGKSYKFKLAFITLTLPSKQAHSDNEIKNQLLNQLLIELVRFYHVKNYLWRAEKQKNGNIHFHILVDKFIPWNELRNRWNRIVEKLGYVTAYRNAMVKYHQHGFKVNSNLLPSWPLSRQLQAYHSGVACHWSNPNSVDIHSLYKVKRIKDYILKYCSKDDANGMVSGRMWGCNTQLSNISGAIIIEDSALSNEVNDLIDEFNCRTYTKRHYQLIYCEVSALANSRYEVLFKEFTRFFEQHFNLSYHTKLPFT